MTNYSKAPRGLFVQLRVTRIFTRTSISPGRVLRQRSTHYTFRAGRNLPDKEFRYLRTVIVTAAIHRGFDSELRPYGLTPPLNLPALGRRQPPYVVFTTLRRPVFLVNSRLGHFSATHPEVGYPSPEVTGTFCRVPERVFSQAPEDSHPTYLCRFAVRSPDGVSPNEDFPGNWGQRLCSAPLRAYCRPLAYP